MKETLATDQCAKCGHPITMHPVGSTGPVCPTPLASKTASWTASQPLAFARALAETAIATGSEHVSLNAQFVLELLDKLPAETPAPTSNEGVSAYTAAEWLSVGLQDKLVPLADYERLLAGRENTQRINDNGAREIERLRAALDYIRWADTSGPKELRGVARRALEGNAVETSGRHPGVAEAWELPTPTYVGNATISQHPLTPDCDHDALVADFNAPWPYLAGRECPHCKNTVWKCGPSAEKTSERPCVRGRSWCSGPDVRPVDIKQCHDCETSPPKANEYQIVCEGCEKIVQMTEKNGIRFTLPSSGWGLINNRVLCPACFQVNGKG